MIRAHRFSLKTFLVILTFAITCYLLGKKYRILDQAIWSRSSSIDFSTFNNSIGAATFIVPNIVHFIKLGNRSFSLIDLVCIRAAWLAQKPDSIIIHCDQCDHIQNGSYWSEIKKVPSLALLPAKLPTHVLGRKLSSVFHSADVLRLEILSKVGGIFLDLDVFVVKNLDFYRRFEISIGVPPKQYLGTQVLVAHPQARFLRLWLDSYRFYKADRWYYNAGELPTTAILMKKPELVHIVPWDFGVHTLIAQVFGVCSAHWRDFHAIHLLSRHRSYLVNDSSAPSEFTKENIKTYNKSFGEMARYVLYGETRVINDKRDITPVEHVRNIKLTWLPLWCDEAHSKQDWRIAKPMPNIAK